MENFEIIQIGNKDDSGLIILLPYHFDKIKLMDLKDIANEYFVSDINKVYFTNEEEVKKNGKAIEFLKKIKRNNESIKFYLF